MTDSLYKEEILEHFRDPQNFGELKDFTKKSRQLNPFCGDEIEIFVKLSIRHPELDSGSTSKFSGSPISSGKTVVEEVSFTGKGCAISIASVSILTEFVKHKPLEVVRTFSENDMLDLLQIEISETRKKCALLGFAVLKDCLEDSETSSE